MSTTGTKRRTKTVKADAILSAAVDQARAAAEETAGVMGVGDHLGLTAEDDRVLTHRFACPHPGYHGWVWSVTLVRASRAKVGTVNEVVLLPGDEAMRATPWVPWADRIGPGDVTPGLLLPTPDDDPRLEPGYTGGEDAAMDDPAEASQFRAVVAELGLGRERVLSIEGRDRAVERWLESDGGPDSPMANQAPAPCASCGYFVRLGGSFGALFGACANEFSPSDGTVVSIDHGCGGHSDVVDERRPAEPTGPVWDSVSWDSEGTLFE